MNVATKVRPRYPHCFTRIIFNWHKNCSNSLLGQYILWHQGQVCQEGKRPLMNYEKLISTVFGENNVTNQLFPIPGSSFPLILRYCDG